MKERKPATCHPEKQVFCRGLCAACYQAARPRSVCHPDQPRSSSDGLCKRCYEKRRLADAPSTCHPDRPRATKGGLCQHCHREQTAPRAICHPDRPRYGYRGSMKFGRGLCKECVQQRSKEPAVCHPDRSRATSDGLCHSCWSQQRAARATCHPDRPRRSADGHCMSCHNIRLKYGIDWAELRTMQERQAFKCAICMQEKPLSVDHCHSTGKVRTLLCTACNFTVGRCEANPRMLARLVDYVVLCMQNRKPEQADPPIPVLKLVS